MTTNAMFGMHGLLRPERPGYLGPAQRAGFRGTSIFVRPEVAGYKAYVALSERLDWWARAMPWAKLCCTFGAD